jgi:hypothetical protein
MMVLVASFCGDLVPGFCCCVVALQVAPFLVGPPAFYLVLFVVTHMMMRLPFVLVGRDFFCG